MNETSIIKCLYFSAVTITTLGYGEIIPTSDLGMILTSSEAILGIVIIGLLLNSLWQSYSDKIEKAQEVSIKFRLSEQNRHMIISYYKYLSVAISTYKIAFAELTIPINKRPNPIEPNPEFLFSDLQDIYSPSLLIKSGFEKSVIRLYFEKQDELLDELKFLLGNFDLIEYPELHKSVIKFLTLTKEQDVRDGLFYFDKKNVKDKLINMIKDFDNCPDLKEYQSTIITPVILLFQTLKSQFQYISLIEEHFESLNL